MLVQRRLGWLPVLYLFISSASQELSPASASESLKQKMLTLSTGASCFLTQGPLSWLTSGPAAPQSSLLFPLTPPHPPTPSSPAPQAASKQNLGFPTLRSGSDSSSISLFPQGHWGTSVDWGPVATQGPRVTQPRAEQRGLGTRSRWLWLPALHHIHLTSTFGGAVTCQTVVSQGLPPWTRWGPWSRQCGVAMQADVSGAHSVTVLQSIRDNWIPGCKRMNWNPLPLPSYIKTKNGLKV